MLARKRYEFVLEAETAIAHHAETIGNRALAMRRRFRVADGFEDVPIITADTMRHKMREAASLALLDAADLRGGLTESALRLLFNGGGMGGGESGAVSLGAYRELCELVPPLALFGGCAANRIVPGRLTVEDAVLICEESQRYVPPWMLGCAGRLETQSAHVERVQRVRMDATLQPHMRTLLTDGAKVEATRRLEASEHATTSGDIVEKEREKSSMLPRTFETVCAGSLFSWACEAIVQSDLELDTFNVAVIAFIARAQVGGKGGTAHGKMRVVKANDVAIASPARAVEELDTTALAPAVGKLFRAHVEERAARIKDFFAKVAA